MFKPFALQSQANRFTSNSLLDGFTLGIAAIDAAKEHHGLRPDGEGRWIEIVLWTDETDAAVNPLVAKERYCSLLHQDRETVVPWRREDEAGVTGSPLKG